MSNDNSNVIILDMVTKINLPPERVLNAALQADLESVVIAGYDKDGNEYFATSIASGPETIWLIERLKKTLLEN